MDRCHADGVHRRVGGLQDSRPRSTITGHMIAGVSTSVTAFVGFAAIGSLDTPVHIFSFAEFEQTFGGLAADAPMSYAVQQFFQNGGTDAYVVRVAAGAAGLIGNLDAKTGIY